MNHLLILFMLLCSATVFAQDVIIKKDGSTIVCRVVELTSTEIVYKKWSNLNGSNYVINRSDASAINYENGKKVNLSEATNLYKPNNQSDGIQQYNDKALLEIDATINYTHKYKRAATISRFVGWGIGIAAVGTGIGLLAFPKDHEHFTPIGVGIIAAGVAWTSGFLLLANHYDKKGRVIESTSIYQHIFKFNNGSTLSASMNMISDRTISSKTLGIGLRYNF